MDYVLFLLATAILFLRPLDFVPELATAPLYLAVLLLTAIVACFAIVRQLSFDALCERPITLCVLGLLPAVILSHLTHSLLWEARTFGGDFAKVVLYYLVLVAVVNTAARLRGFLTCLVGLFLVVTTLAVLQYYEVVTLPQSTVIEQRHVDEETGDETFLPRLCGMGLFNDPNDLCLLLLFGMGIALYRLGEPSAGLARVPWLAILGIFGYALALTQSRGGFLALVVGLLVWLYVRFGRWKAVALAAAALPVLFLFFAGRQTNLTTAGGDTGQDRIQIWSEALVLFKEAPLFGIGVGAFEEKIGLVAHNSFIHCFVELGFFGGTLFLGAFFTAVWSVHRLAATRIDDPELQRLRPYLLAIFAAYGVGMMGLSRAYIVPTYLVLAVATAYLSLAMAGRPSPAPRFNLGHASRLAFVSVAFLVGMHVFVRVAISRG